MKTVRLAYSVKETAYALGVSEWAVREEVRTGRIDSVRLGSRILIPLRELERLVNPPELANDTVSMNDNTDQETRTGA